MRHFPFVSNETPLLFYCSGFFFSCQSPLSVIWQQHKHGKLNYVGLQLLHNPFKFQHFGKCVTGSTQFKLETPGQKLHNEKNIKPEESDYKTHKTLPTLVIYFYMILFLWDFLTAQYHRNWIFSQEKPWIVATKCWTTQTTSTSSECMIPFF